MISLVPIICRGFSLSTAEGERAEEHCHAVWASLHSDGSRLWGVAGPSRSARKGYQAANLSEIPLSSHTLRLGPATPHSRAPSWPDVMGHASGSIMSLKLRGSGAGVRGPSEVQSSKFKVQGSRFKVLAPLL